MRIRSSFLLTVGSASTLLGQLYTGSLTGTVLDPSGAPVTGAKIQLIDAQRGNRAGAKSDGSGRYLLRSLPPGNYSIEVVAPGFEPFEFDDISVDVNSSLSGDARLQLATNRESVEVHSAPSMIQVEDATIGFTPIRKLINDLPLVNRNPFDLAFLAPGVSQGNLNQYFANPQVAVKPAPYADGNASRVLPNARMPGTNNLTASLFKQVPLGFREGAELEIQLESFNVLNHVQFAAPDTNVGDATFGQITAQANQPRQVQLGLKRYF